MSRGPKRNLLDALNSVSPYQAAVVAMAQATKLQDFAPQDQVAGAAMFFVALMRRYPINDPREVLVQAERRLEEALKDHGHDFKPGDQVRALRDYIKRQL